MTAIDEEKERYKQALVKLAALGGGNSIGNEIAKEALNPPVEMEEVEVVRWACGNCLEVLRKQGDRCGNCDHQGGDDYVKLQGTYSRPKKRKVLRREEIFPKWSNMRAQWEFQQTEYQPDAKYYREWYEEV